MTSEVRARLRGLYAVTPETEDTARLVASVEESIAGGAWPSSRHGASHRRAAPMAWCSS